MPQKHFGPGALLFPCPYTRSRAFLFLPFFAHCRARLLQWLAFAAKDDPGGTAETEKKTTLCEGESN